MAVYGRRLHATSWSDGDRRPLRHRRVNPPGTLSAVHARRLRNGVNRQLPAPWGSFRGPTSRRPGSQGLWSLDADSSQSTRNVERERNHEEALSDNRAPNRPRDTDSGGQDDGHGHVGQHH